MPRPFARVLWIAAIAATLAAILIVGVRPQPGTDVAPAPAATPHERSDGDDEPQKSDPKAAQAFIEQAHRAAFDALLPKIEAALFEVAPWEMLALQQTPTGKWHPFGRLNYLESQRWESWAKELSQINADQLDRKRKILYTTASFWMHRTLESAAPPTPHERIEKIQSIADELTGRWVRGQSCQAWRPALSSLASNLVYTPLPETLHRQERQALDRAFMRIDRRLARWRSSSTDSGLSDEWRSTLGALQSALRQLRKRTQAIPFAPGRPVFSQQSWEAWALKELGHSPSPLAAHRAIAHSRERLSRIESRLAPAPKREREKSPNPAQCEEAQQALHERLSGQGPWIGQQVDCTKLLSLVDIPSRDGLMHQLILQGWIEPTRRKVREAQRPLVAALASRWGASVQAQMRELMLLATLPEIPWTTRRQRRLLTEMQGEMCQAQRWLASITPRPNARKTPSRPCPQLLGATPRTDLHGALKGVRTGAMPTTRAVMAGLDRFYWGPVKVALYWASPEGVNPERFGQAPARPTMPPDVQIHSPLQAP